MIVAETLICPLSRQRITLSESASQEGYYSRARAVIDLISAREGLE